MPVTLHAGELTLGLVPPEDLRFHIREAIEIAGAERIGHGVDIMYEDEEQPFETYRAQGVPLALSTDDEGVSRIDLTYEDVKTFSRNSLTYAFLAGDSLWVDPEAFTLVAPCAARPSADCRTFLEASEKARLQWQLETAYRTFEAQQAARAF